MKRDKNNGATRPAERVALEVKGLAAFTTLEGEPKRFKKEVLRVGRWVHPATGEILDFTPEFLARLVEGTRRWIALGNKVWFPSGHSSDSRDNLGFWSGFELEGERITGVLEVQDDEVASKVGKTIQDVSAAIWWNAQASSGETFEAVLEHVCATPCPVIPGQSNFVRLAREANVNGEAEKKTELTQKTEEDPGQPGLDLGAAIRVLVGLPQDAEDHAVIDAVRGLLFDDEDEDDGEEDREDEDDREKDSDDEDDPDDDEEEKDPEKAKDAKDGNAPVPGGSFDPAALATLERQVDELKKENQRIRSRAAQERVDFARKRSIEIGCPIDEDVRKEALALLERGDEEGERIGNRLLELAARAPVPTGKPLPNPQTHEDEKAELDRHSALERAYLSQGLKVEKDQKGRITRVTRPEATKK